METYWTGTENMREMQSAADYYTMRHSSRASGVASIAYGVLNTVIGGSLLTTNPLNGVLVLIGLFMIGEGIYGFVKPSALLFKLDSIALILVGIWNICISVLAGTFSHWFVFGVLQILAAYTSFQRSKRYSHIEALALPGDLLERMNLLAQGIRKGNVKSDTGLITFTAGSRPFGKSGSFGDAFSGKQASPQQKWKARLQNDLIVLFGTNSKEVIVAKKEDFNIELKQGLLNKNMLTNAQGALFHYRRYETGPDVPASGIQIVEGDIVLDRVLTGQIPRPSLERYELWKLGAR